MSSQFSLDDFLGEIGLTNEVQKIAPKTPGARPKGKTRAQLFIEDVRKQIDFVNDASKHHTIEEKISAEGPVLIIKDAEKLAPPPRGKSNKWFIYKDGKLVVSSYYGNSSLFAPIGLKSWDAVIKYFRGLIAAANAGKLDTNFTEIERKRKESRAANKAKKQAGSTDPATGEIKG